MMLHWAFRYCNSLWKKGLIESCWKLARKNHDKKVKWSKLCICSRSSARAAVYSSMKSKPRYFTYSFWAFSSPVCWMCHCRTRNLGPSSSTEEFTLVPLWLLILCLLAVENWHADWRLQEQDWSCPGLAIPTGKQIQGMDSVPELETDQITYK